MPPVPNSISDLSTTAGSNSPSGSETPTEGDNYIRSLSAFIATLRDKLNGTSDTGTIKNATFSGTQAGATAWDGVQTYNANPAGRITSDTYTPTFSNQSNMPGTILTSPWMWTRVGKIVTIHGFISATGVFSSTSGASFVATLPVASNFTAIGDLSGHGTFTNSTDQGDCLILANTGLDRAEFFIAPKTTSGGTINFTLAYEVK